ncbi:ATP-binding cassette domain-containing protein [Microbacterium sp. Se5.02b]|uniref:ATP-binding cassette domain-containing protein n=1 Tax=Microbacterium sp. Se5.02b TaxID=2864103 RepID=UPI001C691251|nr:ATP-binding cassette domain-containing protein [Microbacterium sp. Se5.02b]QYM65132.1 ATP-binding cassette domain-containing protein [Microbacterium sp. Se5.02b]
MDTAIEVRGLHKAFSGKTVVEGLDFEVGRGEVFALLGPNGAGKTTTINILTTLTAADAGTATVAGWDVRTHALEVQRRISLTGQAAAVDDALTATENVIMFARLAGLRGAAARRRAADLIAQFGLADAASRTVRTFSGGMRRRLDLALSFVVTPEVLFLDEPTTGLDTRSRRDLWSIIRMLASAGTTVFLTTQYLEEADQLSDRIAVLHDGNIAAIGTPAALKSRIGGDTVELHDGQGELRREIPTDGTVADLRRALDLLDREGEDGIVTLRRPTLDDVFLAVTSPSSDARTVKELA